MTIEYTYVTDIRFPFLTLKTQFFGKRRTSLQNKTDSDKLQAYHTSPIQVFNYNKLMTLHRVQHVGQLRT